MDFMSDLESMTKLQGEILKNMEGCGTSLGFSTFPVQGNTVRPLRINQI